MKTFKSIVKLLLCGLLFSAGSSAFAQQGYFSTKGITLKDTAELGSIDSTARVYIQYSGNNTYNGSVYMNYMVNSGAVVNTCTTPQVTVTPGATFQTGTTNGCVFSYDSTHFHLGSNIVVVWSSGNAIAPLDSFKRTVYLRLGAGAGISEHRNEFPFSFYPSLASNYIHIDLGNIETAPEKIRVLDVYGREMKSIILSKSDKKTSLDISSLASGVYFIEVRSGSRTSTKKFIKSE